jgi:hypothetical protein
VVEAYEEVQNFTVMTSKSLRMKNELEDEEDDICQCVRAEEETQERLSRKRGISIASTASRQGSPTQKHQGSVDL